VSRLRLALLTVATLWLLPHVAEAQCAMCRATLEGSAEGRAMGSAFNAAILVMIAAPYLIFGGFVAFLFRRRIVAWLQRLGSAFDRPARRQPSPGPT
jgi:hypothetical protein